jgi:phosphate transport system permease protein
MEISRSLSVKSTTNIPDRLKKRTRVNETLIQAFFPVRRHLHSYHAGIVFELGKESLLFFSSPDVNLLDFFTTTTWQPSIGKFGVLPLVNFHTDDHFLCHADRASPWAGRCDLPE